MAESNTVELSEYLARLVQAAERIAPALERIAAALENAPALEALVDQGPSSSPRYEALASVELALAEAKWEQAAALVEAFGRDHPGDPRLEDLHESLRRGREGLVALARSRLDAARRAEDADAALAARDELAVHTGEDDLAQLDQELLHWLMGLIQKRMRAGKVGLDVATWAGEVVDRYGTTREAASLEASLPILRRCAGLCPRCGQPYTGLDVACPQCLFPDQLSQPEETEVGAEGPGVEPLEEDGPPVAG